MRFESLFPLRRRLRPLALAALMGATAAQAEDIQLEDGATWLALAGQTTWAERTIGQLTATGTLPLYRQGLPSGPLVGLGYLRGESFSGLGGGRLNIDALLVDANLTLLAEVGGCSSVTHEFVSRGTALMRGDLALEGTICRSTSGVRTVSLVNEGMFEQRAGTLTLRNADFVNRISYTMRGGMRIESSGSYLDDPAATDAPLPSFINRGDFEVVGGGAAYVARLDNQYAVYVRDNSALEIAGGRHEGGFFVTDPGSRIQLTGAHRVVAGLPTEVQGFVQLVGDGAQLDVDNGATLMVRDQFRVDGRLQVAGTLGLQAGRLEVGPTGEVRLEPFLSFSNEYGTVVVEGIFKASFVDSTGTIVIRPGGRWQGDGLYMTAADLVVDGELSVDPFGGSGRLVLDRSWLRGVGLVRGDVRAFGPAASGDSFVCGTGNVSCVEPGNGLGTLTVDGAIDFRLGSALALEVGRDGNGTLAADLLLTEGMSFEPGSTIRVTVSPDAQDGQFHHLVLATCNGEACDFGSALFSLDGPGVLGYDNTALWVDLPAVPEPANWALMALGMGLLKLRGRRRA